MIRKYTIIEYNDSYVKKFQEISSVIDQLFASNIVAIEHVGSTAVPGMVGKPTIDIAVVVRNIEAIDQQKKELMEKGYEYLGAYAVEDELLFAKNSNGERVINLHFFAQEHPEIKKMLSVRDYLRFHPKAVSLYSNKKRELYRKYRDNYKEYRNKKDEFFQKHILEPALHWSKQ